MELVFDRIPRAVGLAAWILQQDAAASPSMGETARQVASILGILLLTGLWLYLAMHRDRRMATLTVLCILGLASGAGYALGKEARLELLRGGVMQLLLFLEVFVDLTRGWRTALQTVVFFFVTGIVAASVGAALAASLGNAGRVGELIVELLVALFF
jgi:heme/copper-type cytochrome/quinol oxidase subunit 4